jgi:hypothetical protein
MFRYFICQASFYRFSSPLASAKISEKQRRNTLDEILQMAVRCAEFQSTSSHLSTKFSSTKPPVSELNYFCGLIAAVMPSVFHSTQNGRQVAQSK